MAHFIQIIDLADKDFIVNIEHILQIRAVEKHFVIDLNDNEGSLIRISEEECKKLKSVFRNLGVM